MTFGYFVPDFSTNAIESIDQLPEASGLRMMFRDSEPKVTTGFACRAITGPGGRNGTLVSAIPVKPDEGFPFGAEFSPFEFDAKSKRDEASGDWISEVQRWREVQNDDGTTKYFVGWNLSDIPKPEDLRRVTQVQGHYVTLNDGNDWLIPVVGPYRTRLPQGFNAKGQSTVRREFRRIFDASERLREAWFAGGIVYSELWRFAVDLLSINYRVSCEEVSSDILDLVSTVNFTKIFEVATGLEDFRIDQEIKKNTESTQPVG